MLQLFDLVFLRLLVGSVVEIGVYFLNETKITENIKTKRFCR